MTLVGSKVNFSRLQTLMLGSLNNELFGTKPKEGWKKQFLVSLLYQQGQVLPYVVSQPSFQLNSSSYDK